MGFHGKQIQPGTLPLDRLYTIGYIPSAASDLTTVEYVQALNQGLFPKAEARVRAVGDVNLASPAPMQDGIAMVLGDRMVLGDQANPTENGIYDYAPTGLVRSSDANDPGDLKNGTFIFVREGATWGGYGFFISGTPTVPPNIDIGVDPITFSTLQQQVSLTVENGLTALGNNVRLGGPLVQDTDIDGGGLYNMTLSNLVDFEISTPAIRFLFDKGGSAMRVENSGATEVYMNLTDDWRFNLAMDDGGGAGQVNASHSVNLAANGIVNDTNSTNLAANTTLALGAKYSFAAGRNHLIGDGVGTHGNSSVALGIDTINNGEASITSGVGAQILDVANQRGGIAHGFSTGSGLKPVGVPYVAASTGAVNISRNTVAQTVGFGALAQDSVILGGYDHNIPASSPGSVILGGAGIVARASDPNQVYIPNLNITTALLNDDALSEILVRDPATGQIKYRTAGSLAGATDVENGISIDEGFVVLGGPLVQNTEIDLAEFEFNLTSVDPAAIINFELTDTTTTSQFEALYNQLALRSNDASNSFQFVINPLGGVITVGGANPGLQYAADYSVYYTNRSLVDKEYVDSAIAGGAFSLTNGNGTTANGTAVDLGGTLTADVDIEGNFQFIMGANTESLSFISFIAGDGTTFSNFAEHSMSANFNRLYYFNGGSFRGGLEINVNGSELRGGFNGGQGDTALRLGDDSGPNTAYFRDDRSGVNQTGLQYFADYSVNYTNRSLVDKEYVDNAITAGGVTASNGLTKVVNDIQLGGALSANTIITSTGFQYLLTIEDGSNDLGSEFNMNPGSGSIWRSYDTTGAKGSKITIDETGFIQIESKYTALLSATLEFDTLGSLNYYGTQKQFTHEPLTVGSIDYNGSVNFQRADADLLQLSGNSTDTAADNLTNLLQANWNLSNGFQMYRQRYSDIQPDSLYAMFQMNIDEAFIGIYDQGVTGSGAYIGVSNSSVNSDYTPYASVNNNVNNGVMTAFRLKRNATGTGTTNPNAIGVGGRLDYELLIGPVQQVVTGAIDNIATAVGAGWETKFVLHVGDAGALTPVMEIDKYGARHAADYSANYTNRSLVDKEYVDSALAGGDFWSLTGTSTLLSTVTIDGATAYNVNFVDLGGFTADALGSSMYLRSTDSGLVTDGTIGVTGTSANMTVNTTSGLMQFGVSYGGGLFITDVPYARGVQYTANYAANYTNRSLVDKEYVDNAVAGGVTASNGLTETAGDIKLGGALTQNTTIAGGTFPLTISSTIVTAGGAVDGPFRFINDTGVDSAGREIISISKKWTGAGAPDNNNAAFLGFYLPNSVLADKQAISIGWAMSPTAGAESGVFRMTGIHAGSLAQFARISNGVTQFGVNSSIGGGFNGVVIGSGATILNDNSISIGNEAGSTSGVSGVRVISIGYQANDGSHVLGTDSISIGYLSKATGTNAVGIGTSNIIETADSIAIGRIAFINNTGAGSIAIGAGSISHGGAVALGQNSQALSTGTSTAIGAGAKANNSTSIGYSAGNTTGTIGQETISLGAQANSGTHNTGTRSIAIGFDNQSIGGYSVAIGGQSLRATGTGTILMGYGNTTLTNSISESFGLGWGASTTPDILFAKTAASYINSQAGLVIGGNTLTAANTLLDLQSTTKGVAFPRMTTTERDAILAPYDGLMIYNTSASTVNFYDGVAWNSFATGSGTIPAPQEDDRDMVPAVTSGDEEPTGLTITNTPTGLIIIALNGEIKSLGNGVKTKHCYFSGDGGTTARAFSAIVAGDELYWNGIVAGYDLDASDVIDFYYI